MHRAEFVGAVVLAALLVACGGGTEPDGGDADPRDAASDAQDASADAVADALVDVGADAVADMGADAVVDAGADTASDASGDTAEDAVADGAIDATSDASADMSSDAPDADACEYLDLDIFIVDCEGGYRYARRFTDLGEDPRACPDYYTLGAARFDSLEDALASESCDPDCTRGASMSVTLLRCGRRTGYIVYRDREPDCEDAYETPDGIFPSVEAWNEAFPCEE